MRRSHLLIVVLVALLPSCRYEEDALSHITPDEFFLEARDAQSALDAIYHHLHRGSSIYGEPYHLINSMASDLGRYVGQNLEIDELATFNISAGNKVLEQVWQGLYAGINTANFAIENIPITPISDGEKNELVAEARFLRAIFYFDLMRLFGGVPISRTSITELSQNYALPRADLDSVQQFVQEEFTFAFENLPSTNNPGRPTNITAAAFLAKFYATISEFNRAFQASRVVIQSGRFGLLPDYATLFSNQAQQSSESVWSININLDDPNVLTRSMLPREYFGNGTWRPTDGFVGLFDPLDRRSSVTLLTEVLNDVGEVQVIEPHIGKFWERSTDPGSASTVDLHLIRYADILLLHAEIINELRNGSNAEALQAINQVRARARFDGAEVLPILPDLSRMSKEAFLDVILEERARELGWEGQRWFDLVRTGQLKRLVETAKPGTSVEEKHRLFPIPSSEFILNPNIGNQNPGY